MTTRSFIRNGDLAGLVQTNRPRRGRRQIDMPAAHKRAAIVDSHDNAAAVAHPNERSKRQGAVSRGHCRTIETFTVCCAMAAQAVITAVDACNFRTRELAAGKQQRSKQKQFNRAREQPAHIATSPIFEPSKQEGFERHPQTVSIIRHWSRINGKISAETQARN
jgi:hypothetical protein